MYVRTATRQNKRKPDVTYVQLAHNYRDPDTGRVKTEILHNFGRADRLDLDAIRRLIDSLSQLLPEEGTPDAAPPLIDLGPSRPWGGAWVLRRLWERLGLKAALERALADREFTAPVEEALFAMVANRALAPASKRAVEEWARQDVVLGNEEAIQVHHLYRAMDFLLEQDEAIQREVFFATATLLNLECDLILFDTTSSYFEVEEADEAGLRRHGHSKDHRPDLPQAVIGLAVTREGIPVRGWAWPGNTGDASVVGQVQEDLAGWQLARVVWVVDRGMAGKPQRIAFQRGGGHVIAAEPLRSEEPAVREALARPGRFRTVHETLEIKEIPVKAGGDGRRFVLARNPAQAERDRQRREQALERLQVEIDRLNRGLPRRGTEHSRAVCALKSHRTLGRYVRELNSGELRIDRAKVRAEAKLDGKTLLSTTDPTLPAEDVALGYQQLREVEASFRTLKQTLELRPMHHRLAERIRAHVTLCWLALLLVRLAERETGQSWERIRRELDRIHLVEVETDEGRILHRTGLTPEQREILKDLDMEPPPQMPKVELGAAEV